MVSSIVLPITVEEYLAQEEISEEKSEYIEGEIIKMAGASANHNILTGKLHARLLLALEDLGYSVFMSDMKLLPPHGDNYFYPEVMVIKGEPYFTNEKQTAVTNPCLIAEILSASTEGFDKNQKFAFYRTIPELKEYILIDQEDYRVELYRKVGKHQWLLTELMSQQDVLTLESVEIEISLADLYKRVKIN
ncbi:Uma2 family endonuclease [Geminocystis herdmanii]|uniref:Uma2 family endonuclease n=1 Tax=Geminocystis herdmanii TaxID=669359 RepID=UPI0003467603|nr:Uma2 family endonuclease [Geminocystis herdmanii]